MTLTKSILLGSAATLVAVAGAQAADLPSKKAAPATYVKVCDAYGAGFFNIPGTDTCLKVGGYLRYELQYTPAKKIYNIDAAGSSLSTSSTTGQQDTWGTEYRGTINLDARTPTSYGTARTYIALRGTGTTGLRKTAYNYTAGTASPVLSSTNPDLVMERAFVQWAGFTMGLATSNYAMVPSMTYTGNAWSGFPNGQRQLAYTANFGGGLSATVALEDKQMWGNDSTNTNVNKIDTANALVGNLRLDQAWGFAAIHGVVGKHTYGTASANQAADLTPGITTTLGSTGALTKTGWAIGSTVSFNLDMLARGDKLWLTANYADGWTGALMSSGSLTSLSDASSGGRVLGGVLRKDANLIVTGNGVETITGWNVGAQMVHYWAPQWRSVFTAGYIELNPPTQASTMAWGKGTITEVRGSMIYSPVRDLDIGLEVQYMRNDNKVQNSTNTGGYTAWRAEGSPGLSNSNISTKLRVERSF